MIRMKKKKNSLIFAFTLLVFVLLISVFSISFASSRCSLVKIEEISLYPLGMNNNEEEEENEPVIDSTTGEVISEEDIKKYNNGKSKKQTYSDVPTNYLLKSYKNVCETGEVSIIVQVCTLGLKENTCDEIYNGYNEKEVNMEFTTDDTVKINDKEFNFKTQAYHWKKGIYSYNDNN